MKTKSTWTQFWDMHSGGSLKEKWARIYIEAPENEAKVIFYNRFGHNPDRVTCTCCGNDYSISEGKLDQLSAFHRHCAYSGNKYVEKQNEDLRKYVPGAKDDKVWQEYLEERGNAAAYIPLREYLVLPDVKVIYAKDIKAKERVGEVPEQGYVWQD